MSGNDRVIAYPFYPAAAVHECALKLLDLVARGYSVPNVAPSVCDIVSFWRSHRRLTTFKEDSHEEGIIILSVAALLIANVVFITRAMTTKQVA